MKINQIGMTALLAATTTFASPASAFIYQEGENAVRERPLNETGFIRERLALVEDGDTLAGENVCEPFVPAIQAGYDLPTETAAQVACWETVQFANGLASYNQIDTGAFLWLPDPTLVDELDELEKAFRNRALILALGDDRDQMAFRLLLLSGDMERLLPLVDEDGGLSQEVLQDALNELNDLGEGGATAEQLAARLDEVSYRLGDMDERISDNAAAIIATNERVDEVKETAAAAASAAEANTEALADDGWVQSELANKAAASTVADLNTLVGEIEGGLTGEGENPFLRQNDLAAFESDLFDEDGDPVVRQSDLDRATTPVFGSLWGIPLLTWLVLLLAVLALIGAGLLWWFKPSKDDLKEVGTKANEAKEEAESATEKVGEAHTKVDNLTDRVRDVEELQVLQLTLDAQGRFNNPELTDQRLKDLGEDESLLLEIKCIDNYARKVRVSKGTGGDGTPRLNLHGLEKGHDFIDTISLVALYRYLAKARQKDWIIGLVAADKAAKKAA